MENIIPLSVFLFREPWLGGKKPNSLSVSAYYSRQTGYSRSYYNSYYAGNSAKDMYDTDQLMTTFGLSAGLGRRITWPDDFFTLYTEASYQRYTLKTGLIIFFFPKGNSNNLSFCSTIEKKLYR